MSEDSASVSKFYKGWTGYQDMLIKAIAPLTEQQLTLRAAPDLRSIGENLTHVIAVRVRWFHDLMGEGDENIAPVGMWDGKGQPVRTATELVDGLERSMQFVQGCLSR